MPRRSLEQEIEFLLMKIVAAAGFKESAKYRPLEGTQYTDQKGRIFPRNGRFPTRRLHPELFLEVRSALAKAEAKFGGLALDPSDLERLDLAWRAYQRESFVSGDRVPKGWYQLVAEFGWTRADFADDRAFMRVLYPLLYEPMLRGQRTLFDERYEKIHTALLKRDELFPRNEEKYHDLLDIFFVNGAFCFYRFDDPREDAAVAMLRKLHRSRPNALLMATIYGHSFFRSSRGLGASRAMKLSIEGRDTDKGKYFGIGVDFGRAALSAIARGFDHDDRPSCLHGLSVRSCIDIAVANFRENGHIVQANYFKVGAARADALKGRIEVVLQTNAEASLELSGAGLDIPNLEYLMCITESEAYFTASRGTDHTYLIQAGCAASRAREAFLRSGRDAPKLEDQQYERKLRDVSLHQLKTIAHIEQQKLRATA